MRTALLLVSLAEDLWPAGNRSVITDVAAAASTNPARVLGLAGRTGALSPGLDADLVVCDEAFGLRAVMRRGEWVTRSRGPNR